MAYKKALLYLGLSLGTLTATLATSSTLLAESRGRVWRGGGDASWDSRFDWRGGYRPGRSNGGWNGSGQASWDSRFDRRDGNRGGTWRGSGQASWDSRFDWDRGRGRYRW